MKDGDLILTPQLLLHAYSVGVFPMSESRDDPDVFWVDPKRRGVFPMGSFHISRSLARRIRAGSYRISFDSAFAQVVAGCADRAETWINPTIFDLYCELHHMGRAHSVEVWDGDALVGGVYGVTVGAAFFGESMFSRATDASKVGLAYLLDRLRAGGFTLFDTQFLTDHLARLGAIELSRAAYHRQLEMAIRQTADFNRQGDVPTPQGVVQRSIQTS